MRRLQNTLSAAVIILTLGLVFPAAPVLGDTDSNGVSQFKADFDAAMAQPLEQRTPLLESLEQKINDTIFAGTLTGAAKTDALYCNFNIQQQLAQYPDSCQTYVAYIQSIKDSSDSETAYSVFLRDLNKWKLQRKYAKCAPICDAVAKGLSSEPQIMAAALYHLAWSQYWMNGTVQQSVDTCNTMIANCLDSTWRPHTLRLLANAQHALGQHDDALKTLDLLKAQYPGTEFEQYADMRPAAIYEYGKGDPQKALSIYQGTLQRYTDHIYAPYIHSQIERLQTVIENQLIDNALQGIGKADVPDCPIKSIIVMGEEAKERPIVANF